MKKQLLLFLFLPIFGFSQIHNYEYYIPSSTDNNIHHETYYSFSYLNNHLLSEWTIYFSTRERIMKNDKRNGRRFVSNPNDKIQSSSLSDYKGSGYDRGHLVPARDMTFDSIALRETYYLTNITPQKQEFNRGLWKSIEHNVRDLTIKYDSLIIITGCFFTDSTYNYPDKIGDVSVPAFYYKVIADIQESRAFCFIVPNDPKDEFGEDYGEIDEYIYSVDHLQNLTKIDFFYKLPKYQQELLEE